MSNDLILAASQVRLKAYVPYSNFPVGAALRAVSGAIYVGCNVENVAYPEGTCAEAGAIAAMCAGGEYEIAEVAVIAGSDRPVPPCGGCRQKIREFSTPDTQIHICGPEGVRKTLSMEELLPFSFGPENLNK